MIEIITFTSTLTDTGYNRVSSVFWSDVVNEFLHDNGFSDTRTSEETYFTTLEHRSDKVDNFDTCFKNLCLCCELIVGRSWFVNRGFVFSDRSWFFIDWLTEDIEHSSEYFWTNWHRYRTFESDDIHTSLETINRIHGNSTDCTISELLLDFENNFWCWIYFESVINIWDITASKLYIDDDTDDGFNLSCVHKEKKVKSNTWGL